MQLEIGKKTYDLKFGFGFLEEIDKRHFQMNGGFRMGIGVVTSMVQLDHGDPLILKDLIQAATITEKSKPSVKDIETLIEMRVEEDTLDELFIEFIETLGKSPLTKPTIDRLVKVSEQAIKK